MLKLSDSCVIVTFLLKVLGDGLLCQPSPASPVNQRAKNSSSFQTLNSVHPPEEQPQHLHPFASFHFTIKRSLQDQHNKPKRVFRTVCRTRRLAQIIALIQIHYYPEMHSKLAINATQTVNANKYIAKYSYFIANQMNQ